MTNTKNCTGNLTRGFKMMIKTTTSWTLRKMSKLLVREKHSSTDPVRNTSECFIFVKESEFEIKRLPRETSRPDDFTGERYQTFKGQMKK